MQALNFIHYRNLLVLFLPFIFYFIKQGKYESIIRFFATCSISYSCNTLIKGLLRIPHPDFPETFSFPSGHTYMFVCVCSALFFELFDKKKAIFFTLLCGSFEMSKVVINGFHIPRDAISAVVISFIQLMIVYNILYKKLTIKQIVFIGFILPPLVITILITEATLYIKVRRNRIMLYSLFTITSYFLYCRQEKIDKFLTKLHLKTNNNKK